MAVVTLPVVALTYPEAGRATVGALVALLTITVWWAALRAGYRATHVALGVPCATAVGSFLGLLLVSALAVWLPPMRLSRNPAQ